MKKLVTILFGTILSLGVAAGPASETTDTAKTPEDPKQCLKDLESKKDAANEVESDEDKKEPSVIDKIAKKHKLSSLHFQDIIELFY